ncbi:hypothetical protein RND71_043907 [Anisodus tanguticus]|uniref:Gelsolin-like domain-containing protein n=1 Tax=Anisodus tanguticus TaxID=243964 RepID=A0AAE1QRN8_9SOLA|nr:hypothetical protein RND71_043907 [Anisodus tanguticus]
MPPKPPEYQYYSKGSGLEYYNIDFSLPNQLRLAGAPAPSNLQSPNSTPSKDPIARKLRLRRKHRESAKDDDSNQAKVLKGMSELVKDRNHKMYHSSTIDLNLKPKRWDESLEKPQLDYSEFFDSHVGQSPGLFIWEIENFLPNIIDEEFYGKFYEADCYIILRTFTDENQSLDWQIFYWIGANAPLDKKACSAIHAVNLRNYLGAQCRTIREEQNDESQEFLSVFPAGIMYIEGGRTPSGFFTVEETEIIHRMYRLHELPNLQRQLYLETVPIETQSLDSKFVFVLDAGYIIYVWNGKKAKNTMKQKGRLLAEKINKEERKNKAEIVFCVQNDEPEEFWKEILGYNKQKHSITSEDFDEPVLLEEDFIKKRNSVVINDNPELENFKPFHPILYLVGLGMGFLEISQVDFKEGKLKPSLLEPKNVYILDCSSDLFVWFGRKSPRLVKAAALKLSRELCSMINRPDFSLITRCLQGTEPQIFKSKFNSWDNVIAVDFTRTADSVARTGSNLHQWMSKQDVKIDTSALFMLRQPELEKENAKQLAEEWNDELEMIEVLVLEGINAGVAYVWIGEKCDPDEAKLAEKIALDLYNTENYRVSILNEGEEPEEFWQGLDGKKQYDKDCSFMKYTRLFRCSNDKGYFSISEKCSDFCQDDLADDDIMILDNGTQV